METKEEKEATDKEEFLRDQARKHKRFAAHIINMLFNRYLKCCDEDQPSRLAEIIVVTKMMDLIEMVYQENGYMAMK